MKRLFIVPVLCLALGGCFFPTMEQIKTVMTIGTASIANPVTKDRLNTMERAVIVVFKGLNAWKRSCVEGALPESCKQQIRAVQIYTLQINPYLADVRRFVKENDQVNAVVAFNQLTEILGIVRGKAADAGQPLPEVTQ